MITGFRREDTFVGKTYKATASQTDDGLLLFAFGTDDR